MPVASRGRLDFHALGWPGSGVADAFLIAAGKPAESVAEVGENCLYTVRGMLGDAFGHGQMDGNVLVACLILTNLALASYKSAGIESDPTSCSERDDV